MCSESLVRQVDMASVGQRIVSMQQQILSRASLESLIHQYGLDSGGPNKVPIDGLIEQLRKAIEVTAVQPILKRATAICPDSMSM